MAVMQEFNIGLCFARLAQLYPNHDAIVAADITLSYSKLWRITRGFATKMQALDIGRNSTVALHTTDMIVAVATMLAASLLGARFSTLDPGLTDSPATTPSHWLRSPEVAPHASTTYQLIDASWATAATAQNQLDESEFPGYSDPDAPWWILHTSGSTGRPKYLIISQRAVHDRSIAVKGDFQHLTTRFCPLFPCFTRPFFVRATAALLNACTILDTIDIAFMLKQKVDLVCGAPRTVRQWIGDRIITPKIKLLQVSGQKLPDADAETLLHSFEVVEDVYGSSETNKSFVNLKHISGGKLLTAGRPQDSIVEIINDQGKPCQPGERGLVRVRNGYMARGYVDAAAATERAFRGGWFYSGDIAYWGADGALCVVGRTDDLINLGGHKVDPAEVEGLLCSINGIASAAAFQDPAEITPPKLMAMVTLAPGAIPDTCIPAAYHLCADKLGPATAPHVILVVHDIPMAKDGIPRRDECRRVAQSMSIPQQRAVQRS